MVYEKDFDPFVSEDEAGEEEEEEKEEKEETEEVADDEKVDDAE